MRFKYYIIIILSIIICFFKPYNVFAMYPSTNVVPSCGGSGLDWGSYWNNVFTIHFQDTVNHTFEKNVTLDEYMAQQGFYTGQNDYTKTKYIVKTIIENNPDAFGNKTADEVTENDLNEWLQNNITVNNYGDGNVQFTTSGDFNNVVKQIGNDIKENGEKYVYPFDLQTSQYPSGQGKTDLARVMGANSMCLYYYFGSNMVYCINTECTLYAVNDGASGTNRKIVLYKHIESNGVHDVIRVNVNSEDFKYYYWSSSASGYVQGSIEDETVLAPGWISTTQNAHYDNSDYRSNPRYYHLGGTRIKYFDSFTELQEYLSRIGYGKNSYYSNESVWQDFSTSSGDYTVTTDNSNHLTYGDINNYITDSYNTNGTYPSSENITNYITNYNYGGSGSGDSGSGDSGSGDSGSGNPGSGNSGSGDSNIFDWLSSIGSVLGNLIKNLGQVIADLVEGIASVITDLFESIPTIFNDFLGGVIGWLPPELRALITLSISAMVIVGLIKMFKG